MLKEVKFIQSIGRFETAKPTPDATFGPCTLVFGENGWGKSTLADILRSLTTNNPAILAGRKTLASDAPPKAVLRFSIRRCNSSISSSWAASSGVGPRK
jgi:wobble nucleotide-excising tRNase